MRVGSLFDPTPGGRNVLSCHELIDERISAVAALEMGSRCLTLLVCDCAVKVRACEMVFAVCAGMFKHNRKLFTINLVYENIF